MLIDELLSETLEAERHVLTCREHALRFCRGGHGGSEAQQVLEMLHSHWELSDELVQALLRKALVFHADMLMENLHLTIPKSRRYTIIPDWTLTLQPDEVIFKVNARPLEGPAVCFRNPCYDCSEILAVTMADLHTVAQRAPTPELREAARCFFSDAHDVIIMSGQPIGHGSTARSVQVWSVCHRSLTKPCSESSVLQLLHDANHQLLGVPLIGQHHVQRIGPRGHRVVQIVRGRAA
jgi:hypothetical protein